MSLWQRYDFKTRVVMVACAFFYVVLFVELLERRIASAIEQRLAWRFDNLARGIDHSTRGVSYIAERLDAPPAGRRKASL